MFQRRSRSAKIEKIKIKQKLETRLFSEIETIGGPASKSGELVLQRLLSSVARNHEKDGISYVLISAMRMTCMNMCRARSGARGTAAI